MFGEKEGHGGDNKEDYMLYEALETIIRRTGEAFGEGIENADVREVRNFVIENLAQELG